MSDVQTSEHASRFEVHVTAESHFAWLRTRLAVERTMMACMRTAVALIGVFASFAVLLRPV
jgi:putative membrane protein